MTTVADLLTLGRRYHQLGDFQRAEQVYRQVLHADPAQVEGWYLLGSVCQALGKLDEAIGSYHQALHLKPDFAQAHNSLGITQVQQRNLPAAVASFQRAIQLTPDYAQAHNNLGNALKEQGRREEALDCYQKAVRLKPDFAQAHNNLGNLLGELGHFAEAEASCRQAVRLQPGLAEAHNNLGIALAGLKRSEEAVGCYQQALRLRRHYPEANNNLGVVLAEQKKRDEAVRCFRAAISLRPDYADSYLNLANVLAEQGNPEEAVANCRHAVRLQPESAAAHAQLGIALIGLGELDEALASCRRALTLQPNSATAHNSLGLVLTERGQLAEALACFQQSLQLQPDSAEGHRNRSLVWLLQGDFQQGWPEYEWRWQCKELPARPFRQPPWDGGPLEGRTILLHAEQGLGDTLQFIRYAPLVKARGGTVVVVCQRPLLPLLSRCPGIDRLTAQGDALPAFDVHAPLLSLPRLFETTLANIPAHVPYLHADPSLMEHWQKELAAVGAFKVGIAWQGSKNYRKDRLRSIPLARFAPLAGVPGVQIFSLQKGLGSEQVHRVAAGWPLTDLGPRLDETTGPFLDTAAVMTNLDLVITSDTAIPHLAGALGVPVWVAVPRVPDWRWLLDREDSPWYPGMRLFRQGRHGDWESVFRRIAEELQKRVEAPRPGLSPPPDRGEEGRGSAGCLPILVPIAPGELLDKLTILEIKSERIADAGKLHKVRLELAALAAVRDQAVPVTAELSGLTAELKAVNEALWRIEDEIRLCERDGDFGARFIELARSVYHQNDRRALLKRRMNELLGSKLGEEKAYAPYESEHGEARPKGGGT